MIVTLTPTPTPTTPCAGRPDAWGLGAAECTTRTLVAAAELCRTACPIQRACLEGAVARGKEWGVWGGWSFQRPNGRPNAALDGYVARDAFTVQRCSESDRLDAALIRERQLATAQQLDALASA